MLLILAPVLAGAGYGEALPLLGNVSSRPMATEGGREAVEAEYQIKAAFIFNFMKFTEWPNEKEFKVESNVTVVEMPPMKIGIVGKNPFGKRFVPIWKKRFANVTLR